MRPKSRWILGQCWHQGSVTLLRSRNRAEFALYWPAELNRDFGNTGRTDPGDRRMSPIRTRLSRATPSPLFRRSHERTLIDKRELVGHEQNLSCFRPVERFRRNEFGKLPLLAMGRLASKGQTEQLIDPELGG